MKKKEPQVGYKIDGVVYQLRDKLTLKQFGELIKLFPKQMLSAEANNHDLDISELLELDFGKISSLILEPTDDGKIPTEAYLEDFPEVIRAFTDFFKKKEATLQALGVQLKKLQH